MAMELLKAVASAPPSKDRVPKRRRRLHQDAALQALRSHSLPTRRSRVTSLRQCVGGTEKAPGRADALLPASEAFLAVARTSRTAP